MSKTGRLTADTKFRTSRALFGAAVINFIPAVLYWSFHPLKFDMVPLTATGGTLLLAALAIWARSSPPFPAFIALAGYSVYLGAMLLGGMPMVPLTIILYGTIMVLLLIGLVGAIFHDPVGDIEESAK